MFGHVELDYDFNDLEPYTDTLTMKTCHEKYHVTHTKNFNEALDRARMSIRSIEEILSSLPLFSDKVLQNALQNNGTDIISISCIFLL